MRVLEARAEMTYRLARSHLEIMDVDTGAITRVKSYDSLIEAPNWLPGERLLYNAGGLIHEIDLKTSEDAPLDTGFCTRCNNDHVVWGDLLAISCFTAEDMLSRIYTLPLSGGAPTLITPIAHSFLHGISPDGRMLAYCGERNGEYDIYVIPTVGGEETRLTSSPGLNDGPEYAPDGRIWFNSVREGNMQIFRMNPDGSDQVRMLRTDRNDWFPHVSPDGARVAFISYGQDVSPGDHPPDKDVELWIMDADGSNARVLQKLFGGQGTINVNSWAPDSRRIAYVRYERADRGDEHA
ncbi:MAG: TolB family protein [Christensenellales bacterium]|jgi:TolB protein